MRTLHALPLLAALVALPSPARAEEYSFDVDPKLVVITFESNMEVEDILGTTKTVSGSVRLDESGGTFLVEVPVDSLRTGIDMRDQHLKSEGWLDAAKFPKVRFEGTSVKSLGGTKYAVAGTFTMHGVAKPLSVEIDARRIPSAEGTKLGLAEGDWLRVRGQFTVKLSDFGIKVPAMAATKVNDAWTVKVSVFGKAPVAK